MRALQNADHAAFRATCSPLLGPRIIRIARDPRHDAIAVHRRAGVFRRDENIWLASFFTDEKTEAGLVHLQFPRHQIGCLRQHVTVLSNSRDLAVVLQFAQRLIQPHTDPALTPEHLRQVGFGQAAGTSVRAERRECAVSIPHSNLSSLSVSVTAVCDRRTLSHSRDMYGVTLSLFANSIVLLSTNYAE